MFNTRAGAANLGVNPLALDWWAVGLRGVVAILIGFFALFVPSVTIASLIYLFAAFLLIDGVLSIIGAVRAVSRHGHWGMLLVEGVADLAVAAVVITWPVMTIEILIYLMAGWAIVTGVFLLIATSRHPSHQGQWPMRIAAIVSLLWGVLLLFAPLIGALVITWWIAGYAFFFGGSMLALAYRLHRVHTHHKDALLRAM